MKKRTWSWLVVFCLLVLLSACAKKTTVVSPPPEVAPPEVVEPLLPVPWDDVEGWSKAEPHLALPPFLASCGAVGKRAGWQEVCADAKALDPGDAEAIRHFFETRFTPHRVRNPDGTETGTITGYYVPELQGRRERGGEYLYPLYEVPDDLLVIDLRSLYPELGDYRLRGRLQGRRVVPYHDREAIDGARKPLQGKEICWVKDPVELFFLHIQGSGRILLESGETISVNYADQNGYPYRSIGKLLLERGAMTRDEMSMQNIQKWAAANPAEAGKLLAENPSYIFFRELPAEHGPEGALGTGLTPGRSLAVDPRTTPLGAPVFLSTTWPNGSEPLRRLMVAQDTGGAIKGPVRGDFFWGTGAEAGSLAGRMKQTGRMWVLLPVKSIQEARVGQ